ncbi:MAG: hypothetical protein U0586_01000 [Candidatus Brocadiaceae bacterium]
MAQFVAILAWPAVAMIVALIAIFVFHSQLGGLIQRTKRIGKMGLETFEPQPSRPADEKKAIDDFFAPSTTHYCWRQNSLSRTI